MAACSLHVVASIQGYYDYEEAWEPNIGDMVTFTQENSKTCNIIIVDCSIMDVNVNCNRLS